MSTRRVLSVTGDVALQLLRLTAASADVFPPLKSVAGGVLHVAEIVEKFRSNKQEWKEFLEYVQNATASVIDSLARTDRSQTDLNDKLKKLQGTMEDIIASIETKQGRSTYKRFLKFLKDPELITSMRKELDDALRSIISTEINAEKILNAVVANTELLSAIAQDTADTAENTKAIMVKAASISHKASKIVLNANLEKLRYVQGASWDPYRVCLPDTRVSVLENVFTWAEDASGMGGAEIYLLTAVAGAGKTTIAHTVARHFAESGKLVSSFFFDRETEGRNSPNALFTTIAADLAQVSEELSARITAAIERKRILPHAPLSQQFQELILEPCLECPVPGPLVIVIDALDEGRNPDLLRILREEVPRLSSTFRIFLTSRIEPELDRLCRQPHVRQEQLEIDGSANLLDMSKFVPYKFQQLSDDRELGDDWPGQQLRAQFEARAAGLFIWVAVMCSYLLGCAEPERELNMILSESSVSATSAESKMDDLYARILEACNWADQGFVEGYNRIMGTAIATKVPLTISAQNTLFDSKPPVSDFVLRKLSPLMTGMSKDRHDSQPVRVLHQSLRDFLVVRSGNSPEFAKFQVDEQKHSRDLALMCLRLLNHELHENMVGSGYLAKDASELPGVPTMRSDEISEALWYACRFWIDHLLDIKAAPSPELVTTLASFMQTRAVTWVEIMAATGSVRGLLPVREWIQISLEPTQSKLWQQSNEVHAEALNDMSLRLAYEDRREEALLLIRESLILYEQLEQGQPGDFTAKVAMTLGHLSLRLSDLGYREDALAANGKGAELYRQLAKDRPAAFTPDLATSLNNLSNRLSGLGHREEALTSIQEAVELYRQLAKDRPAAFTPDLATSLNNLSSSLSDLGHREEALTAIQEAVELYRQLAKDRPAAFTPDLANSLNNLSARLSDLGHREEALTAIQEAVELRRQLAKDRPAAFTPDFAMSLNNLSLRLSDLGHREEALTAIQEAVELYRQLAKDRPAAFTPDLANSLNNLSARLSDLGHREEALTAIQEAVELRRQLAKDRPAAFTPDLASSLNNLSSSLSDLGHHEEALTAIQEAVELLRQLAKDRPAAFTPDLANSLNNLSARLSDLGHREEALTAIQEAVELRRQLAKDRPAAFTPDLAMSLNNLSGRLSDLGHREEALTAIQEAVELYRQLAKDRPAAFTPDLANSLNNLSNRLSDLGHREEALTAIQEAVELYRQLAKDRPAAFTPDLATSLNNLSNRVSDLGHREEALTAIQEAVELRRQLAKDRPAAFTPDLAMSLYNLSLDLSHSGRREDALNAMQESTALYRHLANDRPTVFAGYLTHCLDRLIEYYEASGQDEEAQAAKQEADEIRRRRAAHAD